MNIDRNDHQFLAAFAHAKNEWTLKKYFVSLGAFERVKDDGYGDSAVTLPERRVVFFTPYQGGFQPAYYTVYEFAHDSDEVLINDRAVMVELPLILRD